MDAVFEHGLAYARSQEFYDTTRFWQWMRFPGDVVFALGALLMAWDFLVKLRPLLPRYLSGKDTEPYREPDTSLKPAAGVAREAL